MTQWVSMASSTQHALSVLDEGFILGEGSPTKKMCLYYAYVPSEAMDLLATRDALQDRLRGILGAQGISIDYQLSDCQGKAALKVEITGGALLKYNTLERERDKYSGRM